MMTYQECLRLEFVKVLLGEWLERQNSIHPTFVKNSKIDGYVRHVDGKNVIAWRCLRSKVVGKTANFSKYLLDMCRELNTLISPTMAIFEGRLNEKNVVLQKLLEEKSVLDNIMLNGGKISMEKYNKISNEIMAVTHVTNCIHGILDARNTCRFVSIHYRKNDLLIEFDDAYTA